MPQYTYNGVTVTATRRRPSTRDDKKYMRTVTVDGKDYLVHYGDPDMEMQRDNPDRREAFLQRHSCDTKKDPLAPGFWACLDWQRTSEKSAGDIDDLDTMTTAAKAGRRNNRGDRQRIKSIRQAATSIIVAADEMEPDEMSDEMKAVQIDPDAHQGAMVALMLSPEQCDMVRQMAPVDYVGECDHVTLMYIGDDASKYEEQKNFIAKMIADTANYFKPLQGKINGYGRFAGDNESYPLYLNYDSPQLPKLRKQLRGFIEALTQEKYDHGFTPHLTIAYLPQGEEMPQLDVEDTPMQFDAISLIWAGERLDFPLQGMGERPMHDPYEYYDGKSTKSADNHTEDGQPLIIGEVKAVKSDDGEWVLDVLGVPFGGHNGGRDSDGEYFSAQTKTYTDRFSAVPAIYYHGYDENNKPSSEPEYIGTATYSRADSKGHWYRVVLDKASDYAKRVWEAAKQGIARASSGSITHLVRKQKDGHITHWPVAELSIFDAIGNRQPANQYAVALPVMKAVWNRAGLRLPDDIDSPDSEPTPEDAAKGDGSTPSRGRASADATETDDQQHSKESKKMEQNEIKDLVAQSVAAALAERDAAEKADQERKDAMKKAAEDAAKAVREEMEAKFKAEQEAKDEAYKKELEAAKAEAAEARRLPSGGAPHVMEFGNLSKYDDLSIDDLSFTIGVLNSAKGMRVNGGASQGASEDIRRALAVRLADSDEGKADEYRAAKASMPHAIKSMKANELNQSTLSSYGDEWVGVTYSTQLWDKIRLQTQIVANIPTVQVPQGSESIVIPVMSTSPTFYKVAQASAQDSNPGRVTPTVTTSRLGTANKTLTVSKLGAAVNYSGELEEDSLIPWVSELRADLIREGAEVLEHVVIDGDTATGGTTNINDIGGTPAGTEPFLLFDGFRKLALVTNTANSRSAGTLTIEDYLETVKLMGLGGQNAVEKSRVAYIIDMFTHWKSLELAELKTQDVYSMPTIEEGVLRRIYGYNVLATNNMHRANQNATYGLRANTAGKVDLDTASNNTTGSILAVRWDQWRLGYKRNWTFEVQRDAISDSTVIVGMMRVGMVYRDTEASAISYNVTLS